MSSRTNKPSQTIVLRAATLPSGQGADHEDFVSWPSTFYCGEFHGKYRPPSVDNPGLKSRKGKKRENGCRMTIQKFKSIPWLGCTTIFPINTRQRFSSSRIEYFGFLVPVGQPRTSYFFLPFSKFLKIFLFPVCSKISFLKYNRHPHSPQVPKTL